MTLLVKQLNYVGQYNGLENVDSEMQSPSCQNEEVRHLAATTSVA
jgi:hypothetical protein